ncbi:ENR1 protein, partial [Dasyornis broadbenti]|nr:ENR1 protein [Dasyornis broadbenti]
NTERLYLCYKLGTDPYSEILGISKFWKNLKKQEENHWEAPDGMFWICGRRAYPKLPSHWKGSCTLGIIQLGFFVLPGRDGNKLGVPL